METNTALISGIITSKMNFSNEMYGEKFYCFFVSVTRQSNAVDVIPVIISERMIDCSKDYSGQYIRIFGQFRSFNEKSSKMHLILSVFALQYDFIEPQKSDANEIFLDGYICKNPSYRKTPLGREISDVILAVNRAYGKADYIPCVCWGRNSAFMASQKTGCRIRLIGRIQSREYQKQSPEGIIETKTAYEVSVAKLEIVSE